MTEKTTRLTPPFDHVQVTTGYDWGPAFKNDGVHVMNDKTGTGTVYQGDYMRAIAAVVLSTDD